MTHVLLDPFLTDEPCQHCKGTTTEPSHEASAYERLTGFIPPPCDVCDGHGVVIDWQGYYAELDVMRLGPVSQA